MGGGRSWDGRAGPPVTMVVPATSANLGPGFDALGAALDLTDEVTAEVTGHGVVVEVTGESAGEVPTDGRHLVVSTMMTTFARLGIAPPPGLRLTCVNRIPHARGLGSSSAAIVAGILLARALVEGDWAARASGDQPTAAALALAAEIEGHPDNVAPCLLGGFVIAWTPSSVPAPGSELSDSGEARPAGVGAVRLTPDAAVHPVVYVPELRGLTAHARATLPERVPHRDAAFNVARSALLVHALTRAPELLMTATEDRLHQPYRAVGAPETAALVEALRGAGVPAVVSGAGPSVLAFTGPFAPEPPEAPPGWTRRPLRWSAGGARMIVAGHAGSDPVAAGRVG